MCEPQKKVIFGVIRVTFFGRWDFSRQESPEVRGGGGGLNLFYNFFFRLPFHSIAFELFKKMDVWNWVTLKPFSMDGHVPSGPLFGNQFTSKDI